MQVVGATKCWSIPECGLITHRTHRFHIMCCNGLGVLAWCTHTYNKSLPALGNNNPPCFHLNRSLSTHIPYLTHAGQFLSGSIVTHRLFHVCCDGLRVLAWCSNTYNKPLQALDNNGLSSFYLNKSLHPYLTHAGKFLSATIAHTCYAMLCALMVYVC